jgi:hypothetical protein
MAAEGNGIGSAWRIGTRQTPDRVGGGVAPAVLPHHTLSIYNRTYGSVYSGACHSALSVTSSPPVL